jgi:K+-transporting ATPase ATPase A chain
MKLISLYILALPAAVLVGTDAFTSSAANNGSAFAGFSGNTVWYNVALALAMVIGRQAAHRRAGVPARAGARPGG